jgi:hypothetical protein
LGQQSVISIVIFKGKDNIGICIGIGIGIGIGIAYRLRSGQQLAIQIMLGPTIGITDYEKNDP